MCLFSGAPENPENDTVMEKHGAEVLYSTVKSLIHAIQTEDKESQQDAADQMIQISKPWTLRRWSKSKLANPKWLNPMVRVNSLLTDL